jgi:hypothetical protein
MALDLLAVAGPAGTIEPAWASSGPTMVGFDVTDLDRPPIVRAARLRRVCGAPSRWWLRLRLRRLARAQRSRLIGRRS